MSFTITVIILTSSYNKRHSGMYTFSSWGRESSSWGGV